MFRLIAIQPLQPKMWHKPKAVVVNRSQQLAWQKSALLSQPTMHCAQYLHMLSANRLAAGLQHKAGIFPAPIVCNSQFSQFSNDMKIAAAIDKSDLSTCS